MNLEQIRDAIVGTLVDSQLMELEVLDDNEVSATATVKLLKPDAPSPLIRYYYVDDSGKALLI